MAPGCLLLWRVEKEKCFSRERWLDQKTKSGGKAGKACCLMQSGAVAQNSFWLEEVGGHTWNLTNEILMKTLHRSGFSRETGPIRAERFQRMTHVWVGADKFQICRTGWKDGNSWIGANATVMQQNFFLLRES